MDMQTHTIIEVLPNAIAVKEAAGPFGVGFYEIYDATLSATMQSLATIAEESKIRCANIADKMANALKTEPLSLDEAAIAQLQERQEMTKYIGEDMVTISEMFSSILSSYLEMSKMVKELQDGNIKTDYILHQQGQLLEQNEGFNKLIIAVNQHVVRLFGVFDAEEHQLENMLSNTNDLVADQTFINKLYNDLLAARTVINDQITQRMIFIDSIMKSLREDIAKLQMQRLEEEAAERRNALKQKKMHQMIEDVCDYEDLEGNRRNIYDAEGNLIEVDEGGDGSSKSGLITLLVLTVLVIAIGIGYFYFNR